MTRMLQTLEQDEKYLGNRLRIVEEKIAVKELREKIRQKRAVIEHLKSKIGELEKILGEPQESKPVEVMVKVSPS